ncbi:uncharacterized protein C1orf131 homolog [Polypterus senegalus]|uniref:uncharacterized protein C1orf131 homolog n=1 Tax=Polypterus senegalus TaxID=55291 RepID=UPI0019653476|nr:uncharacterized protein C1orf131 homolog [Polypterus senegalus]
MSSESDASEEGMLLDHVLNKLYDFGDSSERKKKWKSVKKKRSQCQSNELEDIQVASDDNIKTDHVTEIKESCIENSKCFNSTAEKTFQTAKVLPEKQQSEVQIITFQDPSKKRTITVKEPSTLDKKVANTKTKPETSTVSLEKARLEVHRFGITGYKKDQQRMLEQERAVMLGAKPLKREYVNYKIYQESIKEKKKKEREEMMMDKEEAKDEPLKKKKRRGQNRSKKKTKSGILPTGQVGTFRNGTLILSPSEISKIKSSRVIK